MSEKNLSMRLRDALKPWVQWTRIETPIVDGMPDVNVLVKGHGVEGWIELKACAKPKRDTTEVLRSQHKLRPSQITWIASRVNMGGRAWVAVQIDDSLFILPGTLAHLINHFTWEQFCQNAGWQMHGRAKAKEQWEALVLYLTEFMPGHAP